MNANTIPYNTTEEKLTYIMSRIKYDKDKQFNGTLCWNWCKAINSDGYGSYMLRGKPMKAHRESYLCYYKEIPEGLEIDHLCCNKACCNPLHLEAVTHQENVKRGQSGKVGWNHECKKTHCPRGHEYTEANTKWQIINGVPKKRQCRICSKETQQRLRDKRKELVCQTELY